MQKLTLHRDTEGSPQVLFLHAFPLNKEMWLPVITILQREIEGIGILRMDFPGFGESNYSVDWTFKEVADEIASTITNLGITPVILAGLSMGGYLAFEFYRRYPNLVSGLILSNTKAGADTPNEKESRMEFAADVLRRGPIAAVERQLDKFFSDTTKRERPALVKKVHDVMMAQPPESLANALHAMAGRADSNDLLEQIAVPVTLIAGSEDPISPPEKMNGMSKKIKEADFVEIAETAHLSALEKPIEWTKAAMDLIQRVHNVR